MRHVATSYLAPNFTRGGGQPRPAPRPSEKPSVRVKDGLTAWIIAWMESPGIGEGRLNSTKCHRDPTPLQKNPSTRYACNQVSARQRCRETALLPLDGDTVDANALRDSLDSQNPGMLRRIPVLPETPESIVESSVFFLYFCFFRHFDTFPSPIHRKMQLNYCGISLFQNNLRIILVGFPHVF